MMRKLLVLAIFLASNGEAQEPAKEAVPPAPFVQAPSPAEQKKQTILIPAGMHAALTLTNPMRAKATHPGDSVLAVTSFPVTVGKDVAIPAGTYVEGIVDRLIKRGPTGHAGLEMHFTRMVFANGYNVLLDGATAVARAGEPPLNLPSTSTLPGQSAAAFAFGQQQPPPLPPLPRVGPSIGEVTGITLGVVAAITVTAILSGRRHAGDIDFDAGYQFEMVLQNSLELDADRVAAAVAGN
jgi:type IV secretion system protein VirB10